MGARSFWAGIVAAAAALFLGCASPPGAGPAPDPLRYRLAGSGSHWDVAGEDRVLDDLRPRYPEFFALILDPSRHEEPNLSVLRDDLERDPSDRRNYDALNAIAIAYFEINYRGEAARGQMAFMSEGFRAAKLAAVPWRAYGEVEDPAVREAILDFFEDAGRGEKLGSAATVGRLVAIVESLAKKEPDPARRERIVSLGRALRAKAEERPVRQEPEAE